MGLFDGLKAFGEIVKSGIEASKAQDKLDEAVGKALTDHSDALTDADNAAYMKWKIAKDKVDAVHTKDANAVTSEMTEEVESLQMTFLMGLSKNTKLPQDFRNEIAAAVDEYKKVDAEATKRIQERMLKMCKTEEERQELLKSFEE